MRRVGSALAVLIGLALLVALFVVVHGWTAQGPLRSDLSFTVPQGASLHATARDLHKAEAIGSAKLFLLRTRFLGGSSEIKAGEYRLPKGASNAQIFDILHNGRTVMHLLTIPEGLPSVLVHDRLLANKDLTGVIPVPPEGSVLPDSYAYEKGESRAAVLKRMQAAMTAFIKQAWPRRAPDTAVKTPQEAITLASIVEKETAIPAERPIVAGAYSNRLRLGMMLQADPTTIYPITQGRPLGRRIRESELKAVNAYNTYAMTGLPKGPIANPGRAAILAVLHPAKTKALYFVADGKGGHVFADTLAQQNANVQKWYAIRKARGEM